MFTIRKCVSGGYKIVDFGAGTTRGISAKRMQSLLKSGKAKMGKTYKSKKSRKAASPF